MPAPVFFSRVDLCLILTACLLVPAPCLAALRGPENRRLAQYEQEVFGKPHLQYSDQSRLKELEIVLFGKVSAGLDNKRLDAIARVLDNSKASVWMPPLAPTLDRSVFAPPPMTGSGSPSTSPGFAASAPPSPNPFETNVRSAQSAPAAGSTSGRFSVPDNSKATPETTELLRQALQKYSQGNTTDAEKIFRQVLVLDPHNVDADFNLGAIAEARGDLGAASNHYRIALAESPEDNDIRDALASVSQRIEQQKSAEIAQAAVARKLQLRKLADDASVDYKAGRYDLSIRNLESIAREEPDDPNVQYGLGQSWRGKGDKVLAKQYLSKAVALAPTNWLYQDTLADLERDAEREQMSQAAGNSPDQSLGNGSAGNSTDNGSGNTQSPEPGQITPFANSREAQPLYGRADDVRHLRRGALPALGFGASGGIGASSPGRTRLVHVVEASLSGAVVGALASRHASGGWGRGATRGAIYGGLFGLMTGGF